MIIGHLSLTHIIKSKAEPATARIKRILELISSYSCNLYYIKGKDMVLSDFLSRQNNDDSIPHGIIPISFNMHKVKLCIGQGRAGLKRKISDPINQTISPPSELSQKIHGEIKIETGKTDQVHSKDPTHTINNADERMTHTRPLIPDVPFHPGPTFRPLT